MYTKCIHEDQMYCIPKITIFDNLFLVRDLISIGKRYALDIGFLSLDQENAFDKVDHYIFLRL